MTKEVLTRAKLAEILAEKHGLTKKASKTIVDDVLGIISEEMHSGAPVRFIGFGSFKQVIRKARKGRDPKTGKELQIPERKYIKFKASEA